MDYDKLTNAEKIALAELALRIRRLHRPTTLPRGHEPLEPLFKEVAKIAREIAKEL